jgi:F0F1-type ATP synthase membrane subunit b/b'
MADATKSDLNVDDIQKALEKQIADLRKEITRINKTVSARGAELVEDAREHASDMYDTAATRAAQQLRNQAQAVSEVARDNPGTATAVVGVIGLLGFVAGLVVGQALSDTPRRWYER